MLNSVLLKSLSCFDDNKVLKRLSNEFSHLFDAAINTTISDVLGYTCCSYNLVMERIRTQIGAACEAKGVRGDETNFLSSFVKSVLGDSIDLVCGSFATIDVCKQKMPKAFEEITKIATDPNLKDVDYTVVSAGLKIFEVLEGA